MSLKDKYQKIQKKGGEKLKKNKTSKLVAITLLIVMIALVLVASTYAKYTSQVSGSDTAQIAKWEWKINNNDLTKEQKTFDFNLFDTISDTDGNNEADVKTGKIAPGTKGQFQIKVDNLSEVNANYNLTINATKGKSISNAKIEYSIIGTDEAGDWTEDITTFNITNEKLAMENGTNTRTIYWRWAYSTSTEQDEYDTNVGFDAGKATNDADKSITVNAILNFTQID